MEKIVVSSAIALLLLPALPLPARAERISPGCQNRISDGFKTPAQIAAILSLPQGASFNQLWAIAPPTCTVEQTFSQPGVPERSVFAYAVYDWQRCYLRVEMQGDRLNNARKVCL